MQNPRLKLLSSRAYPKHHGVILISKATKDLINAATYMSKRRDSSRPLRMTGYAETEMQNTGGINPSPTEIINDASYGTVSPRPAGTKPSPASHMCKTRTHARYPAGGRINASRVSAARKKEQSHYDYSFKLYLVFSSFVPNPQFQPLQPVLMLQDHSKP